MRCFVDKEPGKWKAEAKRKCLELVGKQRIKGIFFFFEREPHSVTVARSQLTATSSSWAGASLPPQLSEQLRQQVHATTSG